MRELLTWLKQRLTERDQQAAEAGMPAPLRPYVDAIESTRLAMIAATVGDDAPAAPNSSQLGGLPWWPEARDLPKSADGKPLFLLAQINCGELPELDPLPHAGLLQFFIGSDDLYGANLDNLQSADGFACVYHAGTEGARRTGFEDLVFGQKDYLPLEDPFRARALRFTKSAMPVDLTDYRFAKLLPALEAAAGDDDELFDAYGDWNRAAAIRLGGYPSFTQQDPRAFRNTSGLGDFNLLTVESTDGIMWGDVGIAQFFINEQDLRARDFSKVAYNWDCY